MAVLASAPAYLRTAAATLAALLLAVAAFNALVDPYGIVGTPPVAGLTARKIAASPRTRLTKPYRIEQMAPATIVVGSSAANIGIDPDSPAWRAHDRPVYNLGLDGATLAVQHRFLQHALVHARPRLVVMAVSFEDMKLAPRLARSDSSGDLYGFESRLRVTADGRPNRAYLLARLSDLAFATLSLTALRDSVTTLMRQNDPEQNAQTAAGMDARGRFVAWIAEDGTREVIERSLRQRMSELLRTETTIADEIGQLAAMVRESRAAGADVVVLVLPAYVAGLEARRRMGLSAPSQVWLADMVAAVEAAAGPDQGRVAIWNFEGYDTPVQQPLPSTEDRTPMRWFWEGVHFRPELGTLMLQRIMGAREPADFGVRLTAATVAAQAARYAEGERAWVARHPAEAADILDLTRSALDAVCRRNRDRCSPPPPLLP